MNYFCCLLLLMVHLGTSFAHRVVNVYVWGGIVPKEIIYQFEQETGIHVNYATYDNNETMYTKLKASRVNVYDVILPSSYYVERMKKQGMLLELDHRKLSHLSNLDPMFRENEYDLNHQYSVPLIWGVTGIFYNKDRVKNPPKTWQALWQARWKKKLLLLDDSREVFSIALMSLGYSPNEHASSRIKRAYEKLLALIPNIKLFASESVQAILIDEDAIAGAAWNGDVYKAKLENPQIDFIYPEDGFVIWVDSLAIPANPPHPAEAYSFINYLLKANIAQTIALSEGHAITNAKGKALLPESIRNNSMIYPSSATLRRGYFQRDIGDQAIEAYNQYWGKLKLSF